MTKSGKHCGKRRNFLFRIFFSFVTVFKEPSAAEASDSVYMRERVKKTLEKNVNDFYRKRSN